MLLDTHLVSRSDIGDQLPLSLLTVCDEVAGQGAVHAQAPDCVFAIPSGK